jgi:3-hydroxyacyl-CoA dehydrogenase
MAAKRTPAPKKEQVNLRGKMGREIAQLIADGDVSMSEAEEFVATRAVEKLRKECDKLPS